MNIHEAKLELFKNRAVFDAYIAEIRTEALAQFRDSLREIIGRTWSRHKEVTNYQNSLNKEIDHIYQQLTGEKNENGPC